ncbi:DUF397 domain-containing protein [Actinomadura sp. LD22]|uniref:DUF397 domain-containing protein n=1 Tax=Actinomadura physcomitrii TaxID=2650748 RepID=A0A6I4MNZ5_9ACTN|nr:DUF397 domain-containing protein [Actinomadura physcomitrii]MWA05577.1 DUF397 domain-containing protein [Actinomadura physcomitrii]
MTSPAWRKSSYSTEGTSAQCVEVAALSNAVGLRDSRQPDSGHLTLAPEQFAALVRQIKNLV